MIYKKGCDDCIKTTENAVKNIYIRFCRFQEIQKQEYLVRFSGSMMFINMWTVLLGIVRCLNVKVSKSFSTFNWIGNYYSFSHKLLFFLWNIDMNPMIVYHKSDISIRNLLTFLTSIMYFKYTCTFVPSRPEKKLPPPKEKEEGEMVIK